MEPSTILDKKGILNNYETIRKDMVKANKNLAKVKKSENESSDQLKDEKSSKHKKAYEHLDQKIKMFTSLRSELVKVLVEYIVHSHPKGITLFDLKNMVYSKLLNPKHKLFSEIEELYLHEFLDEVIRSKACIIISPCSNNYYEDIKRRYERVWCFRPNKFDDYISDLEEDIYMFFTNLSRNPQIRQNVENGEYMYNRFFKTSSRGSNLRSSNTYCKPIPLAEFQENITENIFGDDFEKTNWYVSYFLDICQTWTDVPKYKLKLLLSDSEFGRTRKEKNQTVKTSNKKEVAILKPASPNNADFWEYLIVKCMSKIEVTYLPTFKKIKFVVPTNAGDDNLSHLSLEFQSQFYSEVLLPGNPHEIPFIDFNKYEETIQCKISGIQKRTLEGSVTKFQTFDLSYILLNVTKFGEIPRLRDSTTERLERLMDNMSIFYRRVTSPRNKEEEAYKNAFSVPRKIFTRLEALRKKNLNLKTEGFIFVVKSRDQEFYRVDFESFSTRRNKVRVFFIDYASSDYFPVHSCFFLHKNFCHHHPRQAIAVTFDFTNIQIIDDKNAREVAKAYCNKYQRNICVFDFRENDKIIEGPLVVSEVAFQDKTKGEQKSMSKLLVYRGVAKLAEEKNRIDSGISTL